MEIEKLIPIRRLFCKFVRIKILVLLIASISGTLIISLVLLSIVRTPEIENGSISEEMKAFGKNIKFDFEDVPLGENSFLVEKTERILKLDDYVYRRFFLSNGIDFFVFVAFWTASKDSRVLTAKHNPDVCWVGSGWIPLQTRRSGSCLVIGEDRLIDPVEYRFLKTPNDTGRFHTYFWQTWGGEVVPVMNRGDLDHWLTRVRASDYWRIWAQKRKPLYFIRIHSKTPLAPVVEGTGNLERGERRGELGSGSAAVGSLNEKTTQRSTDTTYLIDHPGVRELLLAIHRLTTSQAL